MKCLSSIVYTTPMEKSRMNIIIISLYSQHYLTSLFHGILAFKKSLEYNFSLRKDG